MHLQEVDDVEANLCMRIQERQPNTLYKFKICLIGDGGTGKTTFINRVLNGVFITKYFATQGVVARPVTFQIGDASENCFVKYVVWDTAGQEKNSGLKDGYYIEAIAGFFFFDLTSRETMANIPKYLADFQNACGVPDPVMIVVANKSDLVKPDKKVDLNKLHTKIKSYNAEVIQMSAKNEHNFSLPFDRLTRILFNDPKLMTVAAIDFNPLNVNYDIFAGDAQTVNAPEDMANLVPEEHYY
uniref:GTP-binding nuclear protein n=1 Tax=Homalodisca liturata TaxID=320908 RepID=A0A1B6J931_9HEMI